MKKVLAVLFVMVLVFTSVFAEATPEAAAVETKTEAKEKQVYSMIEMFDITTLDYVYNNKSSNGDYTSNFIEGLLTQNSHGTLVAGMAESWEANADATVWTFTIRDNAVWSTSEGEEYAKVTAEDFVTGLKHAVATKSETLSLVRDLIVGLKDYEAGSCTWDEVGIKAEGNKLTYTLTQPCGYFDGMTTYSILFPVNAEFLEAKGDQFGLVDKTSILYNGCYLCSSIISAQEVKMIKNENYWDKDNVFIDEVIVTYTDGSDAAQAFNMFVNGETSSASINSSLPDVVAKADELYKDNQYKSMTTATSFWGAFNFDRSSYALYNDPSFVTTTKLTDEAKADAKNAILNKYFRLAIFAAYSTKATQSVTKGDERALDAARNTLVPYTFATTSDGQSYGALLTSYLEEIEPEFKGINLNDGQDAWYNPERAVRFMEKAKEELGSTVSSWPITLDYPVVSSSANNTNMALAMKNSIESVLGDYVKVNLVMFDTSSQYYASFYSISQGYQNSIDFAFGAGWGPDYGDPLTYIHCFDADNGDMLQYSGLDTADLQTESGKAAKDAIGLTEIKTLIDEASVKTGDERIKAFAYIEANLLAEGILRSYSTSGANLVVSKVVPFSAAYGLYGQAAYNAVPYFKYMQLQDTPVTTEQYYAAKEAWLRGE